MGCGFFIAALSPNPERRCEGQTMNHSADDLIVKLEELLRLPTEDEVVEFKTAAERYDPEKLSRYVSALANEANLRSLPGAWLVFGVNNDRRVVGTNCYTHPETRQRLKHDVKQNMTDGHTFARIDEVWHPNGRVLMFLIPAAPQATPIAYKGHCWARAGESLVALGHEKEMRIRSQAVISDWSAGIVQGASLSDLNPDAIRLARELFRAKHAGNAALIGDCEEWDAATFLNKAKITLRGGVTRASLLLLGKEDSAHLLAPANPQLSWILEDHTGQRIDYAHFGLPFLFSVRRLVEKIRVLKYRYLPVGSLFPEEVDTYDPYVIREAIYNCIAHQDYTQAGRVNVVEGVDHLVFTNRGAFIPGDIEKVIVDNAPEEQYRNPFLVTAMNNLQMVEYIGSGIRRMFTIQSKRFFPLPDYDLSRKDRVKLTITGKVLDLGYASMLARNSDLGLHDIMLLDKVQKRKPLAKEEAAYLRQKKLIEGRAPNYFIAKSIASRTGDKIGYSKRKGLPKRTCENMIREAIREHGSLTRKEIDKLLEGALSELYNELQRKVKISNILRGMRSDGDIENKGTNRSPIWVISTADA